MKPGNPPAKWQEGCQFRRSNPRDEGNSNVAVTPEMQGFFCWLRIVYFTSQVNKGRRRGRVSETGDYRELVTMRCQCRTGVENDLRVAR